VIERSVDTAEWRRSDGSPSALGEFRSTMTSSARPMRSTTWSRTKRNSRRRPSYSLICTKNQASWEWRVKQRTKNLADLAALKR
jgi:hypothetical protein